MVVHSLYIINKAGSLMYHHDFIPRPKLDGNDYLRLASAFHAFYVISTQLCPKPNLPPSGLFIRPDIIHSSFLCVFFSFTGIHVLDTNTFRLCCMQTLTGIKFWVTADPTDTNLDEILNEAYIAYCDWCLKNPFYELEQIIKQNAKFDSALNAIVAKYAKK